VPSLECDRGVARHIGLRHAGSPEASRERSEREKILDSNLYRGLPPALNMAGIRDTTSETIVDNLRTTLERVEARLQRETLTKLEFPYLAAIRRGLIELNQLVAGMAYNIPAQTWIDIQARATEDVAAGEE